MEGSRLFERANPIGGRDAEPPPGCENLAGFGRGRDRRPGALTIVRLFESPVER